MTARQSRLVSFGRAAAAAARATEPIASGAKYFCPDR